MENERTEVKSLALQGSVAVFMFNFCDSLISNTEISLNEGNGGDNIGVSWFKNMLKSLALNNATAHEYGEEIGIPICLPKSEKATNRIKCVASEQISTFAEYLRANDKAPKTVQGYTSDVKTILKIIAREHFNGMALELLDLSKITQIQVKSAEQALYNADNFKIRTFFRYKQGWGSFCAFIGMKEWQFTQKINATQEYKNEVISNGEVTKTIDYCTEKRLFAKTDTERIRWFRKEIAIRLGYEIGFRSCEYGNAKFDEIGRDGRITITQSKHNGVRAVAVTKEISNIIAEFKNFLEACKLFPANGGIFEKSDGKSYSTSTFRRWLKQTAEACCVAVGQAKTHGLRHRFARNFYSSTLDESMLANIMGHKSMKTTRQYTIPTFENQRDLMQKSVDIARGFYEPQAAA
ncbi:MAG: site-specific integrase [Defluviitaleaceae bacterium]|nr:site-specific integrase [Defluviitaleaceae bacterium]